MGDDMHHPPPRRHFLRQAISVAGAALVATGANAANATNAANTPAAMPAPVGYKCFSADEAAVTETMVNVMCPADQFTPNGGDCGLGIFMDRQLSGAFGQGAGRYMSGAWREGKPELGLQLPLTPEQFYKAGVQAANHQAQKKFGKTFDQLPSADADAFLNEIAGGKIGDDDIP